MGRLIMAENPAHHPEGGFGLDDSGILDLAGDKLTYTGLAILSPELVKDDPEDVFMLRKVFDTAVANGQLEGIVHDGFWCDVGTVERYRSLIGELEEGDDS